MMTITLKTLLGSVFASKSFKADDRKAQRRWIDQQETKYGASLSRSYVKLPA